MFANNEGRARMQTCHNTVSPYCTVQAANRCNCIAKNLIVYTVCTAFSAGNSPHCIGDTSTPYVHNIVKDPDFERMYAHYSQASSKTCYTLRLHTYYVLHWSSLHAAGNALGNMPTTVATFLVRQLKSAAIVTSQTKSWLPTPIVSNPFIDERKTHVMKEILCKVTAFPWVVILICYNYIVGNK